MRRVHLHTRPLLTILFVIIILITIIYFIATTKEENFILGESISYVDLLFKNTSLNAYVVEEHHEVLQYWFEAARRKIIPDSGNTLIHIDGHSDMGLPFFYYEFPYFRAPKDRKDIHFMMQRNDIFIIRFQVILYL
ncbi:hypothetical protein KUTeg_003547 [Tegillarca granosa]|uniref:Uncharacterized protein n=1 Tax=Tegillarca granosa TaxID=220873 RepID=A0ABQ9FME5_TEGGR|nr:hypothetical protein KUTeg_003547 [Tegillarca granosa]